MSNPNDTLDQQLNDLHAQQQPDSNFVASLEATLRQQHPATQVAQTRPHRWQAWQQIAFRSAASFVLIVALFATVPPLRAMVSEMFTYFFPVPAEEVGDYLGYSRSYAPEYDTLAEAQPHLPFAIKLPQALPDTVELYNVRVTENSVNLEYQAVDAPLGTQRFEVTQYRIPDDIEQDRLRGPVAEDAEVTSVMIGDVRGEYVNGYWQVTRNPDTGEDEFTWHVGGEHNMVFLFWQEGDTHYEISALGETLYTAEELVAIAESLQ